MCLFRFPDPIFERRFYFDVFGVEPDDCDSRKDFERPIDAGGGPVEDREITLGREPALSR